MRSSSVKLQMENNAFVDPDLASGTFVDGELRSVGPARASHVGSRAT